MKNEKHSPSFYLTISMISAGITPTDNIENNTQKAATMAFQNVNTQTINVDGTDFYYRKLGIITLVYR